MKEIISFSKDEEFNSNIDKNEEKIVERIISLEFNKKKKKNKFEDNIEKETKFEQEELKINIPKKEEFSENINTPQHYSHPPKPVFSDSEENVKDENYLLSQTTLISSSQNNFLPNLYLNLN
jgi:hypothetical protein